MIVITGAAGFIPSCLAAKLNEEGYKHLILVDDFSRDEKKRNYASKTFDQLVDRKDFPQWLRENHLLTEFVFHLGARTDTTEFDVELFNELNLNYTKEVWKICVEFGLPLLYASSATTYGLGEHGYSDSHEVVEKLSPLNPYGDSKNDFDKWALQQERQPYFWAGIKFFNVYGPNEYHKGRMASVVYHTFNQVKSTSKMKLFRSHKNEVKDGHQSRDFIYVKDVVDVLYFFMHHRKNSGLYNLGTGTARPFIDLVKSTFEAMGMEEDISFIDTPEDIRNTYQYWTQAEMKKLKDIRYSKEFTSLEDGIKDYVQNYLEKDKIY